MARRLEHELAIYAFDLLHLDGEDLRPLPLTQRRLRLEWLLKRTKVPCLHLVEAFDVSIDLVLAKIQRSERGHSA